jgi:tripartite-type tricarboxylate transporter receptor subunit TctC
VALMAGEVQAMFGGNSTAGQIRAGKIRALALAGAKRSTLFSGLPTIGEFYPGFASQAWLALFAPSGLPPAVLSRLRADAGRTVAEPETAERLRNAGGLEQWVTTPDEFAAFLRVESAKYAEIVKAVGVKIE